MKADLSTIQMLTRLLDEVGAIVWEGDPQTYAFTYVSPGAERLLGYPARCWIEDLEFWVAHIHPDDREWVLAFCRDCTNRLEDHEFDYRMIAADGRVVWLRDVVRVEGRDGQPVRSVGVMTDVTSLKAAEARASEAERALITVLETVRAINEGLRLDEVVLRTLSGAAALLGADRGAIVLEHARGLALVAELRLGRNEERSVRYFDEPLPLHEAGSRAPAAIIEQVLRTGEPMIVNSGGNGPCFADDPYFVGSTARALLCVPIMKQLERIGALVLEHHQPVRRFDAAPHGALTILLAQAAIAIEHARLYAKVQRGEAQWRSLVDGLPDIVALLDERGRIEFVNHLPACVETLDELNAVGPTALLDLASGEAWDRAFTEVVTTGERRQCEVRTARQGDSLQWFMTRFAPVEIVGLGSGRYLSISTDMTGQKRLEAQLRQQLRLESLGTLASGVAHEINNPIQGILNYAELIGGSATEPETVRDFAGEIAHESERVAAIVRSLLAFSRQDFDPRFEACEVRTLIDASLKLFRAVLRKDQITIDLDIPDELSQIRCRSLQIQQIIMNLVTNARDALNDFAARGDPCDRGGDARRIAISARALTRGGRPWVRISVADRAGGIPEAVRTRIFDPFFTTKGPHQGTGLGLAVSHGIAAEHGGELTVESEVGVGSTFHLDLPAISNP
jgi:PAS domain S-box-containing protein